MIAPGQMRRVTPLSDSVLFWVPHLGSVRAMLRSRSIRYQTKTSSNRIHKGRETWTWSLDSIDWLSFCYFFHVLDGLTDWLTDWLIVYASEVSKQSNGVHSAPPPAIPEPSGPINGHHHVIEAPVVVMRDNAAKVGRFRWTYYFL